jgi:hypothetical protein
MTTVEVRRVAGSRRADHGPLEERGIAGFHIFKPNDVAGIEHSRRRDLAATAPGR